MRKKAWMRLNLWSFTSLQLAYHINIYIYIYINTIPVISVVNSSSSSNFNPPVGHQWHHRSIGVAAIPMPAQRLAQLREIAICDVQTCTIQCNAIHAMQTPSIWLKSFWRREISAKDLSHRHKRIAMFQHDHWSPCPLLLGGHSFASGLSLGLWEMQKIAPEQSTVSRAWRDSKNCERFAWTAKPSCLIEKIAHGCASAGSFNAIDATCIVRTSSNQHQSVNVLKYGRRSYHFKSCLKDRGTQSKFVFQILYQLPWTWL